jgi:hypothetical protein
MRTYGFVTVMALALALAACGGKGGANGQDAASDATLPDDGATAGDAARDGGGDGPTATDGGGDGGTACPRTPAAADRIRKVVVSHPYDSSAAKTNVWEVLDLSTTGALTRPSPNVTFTMGVAMYGEVVFTPDGEVGIVAQDDGSLGVFRLDANGTPAVVHAKFEGSFYAGQVVMDPDGTGAWVLDSEWRDIGGGIYRVDIGCDGTLTDQGRVAEAKLPAGLVLLPDGRAVVSAYDILTSAAGTGLSDVHLLGSLEPPTLTASVSAFPTSDGGVDEQIVSTAAATSDGKYVLIADDSAYRDYGGTRIAAVEILASSLRAAQVFNFDDPVAIVASPFGKPVIGVNGGISGAGAIMIIDYDSASSTPFSVRGELPHTGTGPQLPGAAVMINQGSLKGFVLVAELSGVRKVAFHSDFTVTDLGAFDFGSGYTAMVGAVGVQP